MSRRTVTAVFLLIILPLFLLAVIDPPSIYDALSYHLPRMFHWIENGNIKAYPTGEARQVFLPPFGDVFFLHWYLLSGSDYFVNTVQLAMLIGVFLSVSLLAKIFGLDAKTQLLASLFILLLPTLLAESCHAMTDVTATFFFLSFLYFGFKSIHRTESTPWRSVILSVFFMGLSLSLGINTKMTVAIFAIPFCIWFGLRYLAIDRIRAIPAYLLLIFLFLGVNTPFFLQNYRLCGTSYGDVEMHRMHANAEYGLKTASSNFLRIFGFQLMTPWPELNAVNVEIMQGIHNLFGMGWDDPDTTFMPWAEQTDYYHNVYFWGGETTRNVLATFLLVFCLFFQLHYVFFSRKESKGNSNQDRFPKEMTLFILSIFAGFFIYALLIRWSPHSSRLTMLGLVALAPFCAFVITRLFRDSMGSLVILAVFFGTWFVGLLVHHSLTFSPQAVLTSDIAPPSQGGVDYLQKTLAEKNYRGKIHFCRNYQLVPGGGFLWRQDKLFEIEDETRSLWKRYLDYRKIKYFMFMKPHLQDAILFEETIERLEFCDIGYWSTPFLGMVEYPLWHYFKQKGSPIRVEWIHCSEYYKKSPNYHEDFVPEAVILDNYQKLWPLLEEYELGDIYTNFRLYFLVEIRGKRQAALSSADERLEHVE